MGTTHRTADQWQVLVNEQKASGLSAPKYCEQNNIAYASFSKWRKQLTKPTPASESPAFIELTKPSKPEPQSWAVELALSDTIVLRIAQAQRMLFPEGNIRVWLCTIPTDMRKTYNGLSALVKNTLHENPLNGHLYVFINRRRTQMKILFFNRNGYVIWSKRLEQGEFVFHHDGEQKQSLSFAQLQCLLEGIELKNSRRYKRFSMASQ